MKRIKSFNYTVASRDTEILKELIDNDYNTVINWYNFNQGDIYYSDNCEEYCITYINHEEKYLELNKI